MPELLCEWFYVYVMGKWAWISERNMGPFQRGRRCGQAPGHPGLHTIGDLGHEVPVPRSDALRERAREMPLAAAARRRVAAKDVRHRAARALDRYIEEVFARDPLADRIADAATDFVESVGDYAMWRLQQKSHYGVAPGPACMCVQASDMGHDPECPRAAFARGYGGDNPDGFLPTYRPYNPQDPSTHPPTCGCPVCVQ